MKTFLSYLKALLLSAALGFLIPWSVFEIGQVLPFPHHPYYNSFPGPIIQIILCLVSPTSMLLIITESFPRHPNAIARLFIGDSIYYSVMGTFIWLGFRVDKAFWIPVKVVVPLMTISFVGLWVIASW